MLALLSPRLWLALALAGLLAFTHYQAFTGGKAAVNAAWTTEKLAASEAARQREKALTIATQGIDRAYQNDKKRIADLERDTAQRLREFQSAATDVDAASPSGRVDDPYRAIADQCAAALESLDGYTQGLAAKTTALQRYAREVCLTPQ